MLSIFHMTVTSLVATLKKASVFLKEEKICYKMAYYTLYLSQANRQKSCYKIRIFTDFSERDLALKGLIQ